MGNIVVKVGIEIEEIPPSSVEEVDVEGPVVFSVVRDPGAVHTLYERPPNVTTQAMGDPMCPIHDIRMPQYDQPLRFPGILDMKTCGDCDECPSGLTWSPVYVEMPVLTALYDANDTLTDWRYVMDLVTVPVTCSCQRLG